MNLKSTAELEKTGAVFETIVTRGDLHTVEDVERACKCTKQQVLKTLVFVGQKPVVVIVTGDKKVDAEKLKKVRGDGSLRMASRDEVRTITGYSVGTVSPFGLCNVDVIADSAVLTLSSLIMGSGKNDTLIKMTCEEFQKSFNGPFVPITLSHLERSPK